jgi:[ribosomal protein S5]-alanine N-acetyltransferase
MNRLLLFQPVDLLDVSLESERVRLQSISDAYAPEIFREFTEEITRYMYPAPPARIEETLAFIARVREGMQAGSDLGCAIRARESEEFLGCCGLHGKAAQRAPELGIWLKKGAHGHGFGREAIARLARWAWEQVDFDYLVYPVDRANVPSRRIPEFLGGTIFKEGLVPRMNGGSLDEVVYRIPRGALTQRFTSST